MVMRTTGTKNKVQEHSNEFPLAGTAYSGVGDDNWPSSGPNDWVWMVRMHDWLLMIAHHHYSTIQVDPAIQTRENVAFARDLGRGELTWALAVDPGSREWSALRFELLLLLIGNGDDEMQEDATPFCTLSTTTKDDWVGWLLSLGTVVTFESLSLLRSGPPWPWFLSTSTDTSMVTLPGMLWWFNWTLLLSSGSSITIVSISSISVRGGGEGWWACLWWCFECRRECLEPCLLATAISRTLPELPDVAWSPFWFWFITTDLWPPHMDTSRGFSTTSVQRMQNKCEKVLRNCCDMRQ